MLENWKTIKKNWKPILKIGKLTLYIGKVLNIKKPETNIGKLVKESTEFHLVVTAQLNLNMSWSLT